MEMPHELQEALVRAGQEHVLAHVHRAEGGARRTLVESLRAIDLDLIQRLFEQAKAPPHEEREHRFEPPELFPLERDAGVERAAARARQRGEEELRAGRLAYCLVAGGQASRLGYDAPKGAFPIGPVTERTLFEYHAHRLRAAARRFGVRTPWYIMTSPVNDAPTREIFEHADHFGLPPEDVFFFQQEMLPALDQEGRVLFAARDRLFLAPNGHGGSLLALARSGALADMRGRGVETISYFQVDNPLVRPADTLFLGLHVEGDCGMSSKVVSKRDAGEKVGVIGRIDGRLGCIEYSDLPPGLREAREGGELRFRAGNIAAHLFQVGFVEDLTRDRLELPWHVARKRMKAVDTDGREQEREGFKFETFVFDALGFSDTSVTLEVSRAEEFSPVKNAEGADSPGSCRADLCQLFGGWLQAAGEELPPSGDGPPLVEVDPLFAETEDEFRARPERRPRRVKGGLVFEEGES